MSLDRGGIILEGIPIPPSSNNQYKAFVRNNRIIHARSQDLLDFKKDFEKWAKANSGGIRMARAMLEGSAVEVEAFIGFHRERLFTKKDTFKRLDVSNRIKALHDCLSDVLGIDDSAFFAISAEKFVVEYPLPEQVIVRLSPFLAKSLKDVQSLPF